MGTPRYSNGYKRRQLRAKIKSLGLPCAICGRPIDYNLTTYKDPKDGKIKRHPLSYELDEIIPVSKGGSPIDPANVQPAHRICNQRKQNKIIQKTNKLNKSADQSGEKSKLRHSRNW